MYLLAHLGGAVVICQRGKSTTGYDGEDKKEALMGIFLLEVLDVE